MLRRGRVDTKGSNVETATQPLRDSVVTVVSLLFVSNTITSYMVNL
jgi:hypothetical protein